MPPEDQPIRVLVTGLERQRANALVQTLAARRFDCINPNGEELNAALRDLEFGAAIFGARAFIALKRSREIAFPCIVLGDDASDRLAIQSFRLGAYNFLEPNEPVEDIIASVENATATRRGGAADDYLPLLRAKYAAEAANRAKSEFFAAVNH